MYTSLPSGEIASHGLSPQPLPELPAFRGRVHVRPWSKDFERAMPGFQLSSHAMYTVPSFATRMIGSACHGPATLLLRQSSPHTNRGAPQVAPRSEETRTKIDGSGHCRHAFASMPVATI